MSWRRLTPFFVLTINMHMIDYLNWHVSKYLTRSDDACWGCDNYWMKVSFLNCKHGGAVSSAAASWFVLPMLAWASSGYSSFLLPSKHAHIRWFSSQYPRPKALAKICSRSTRAPTLPSGWVKCRIQDSLRCTFYVLWSNKDSSGFFYFLCDSKLNICRLQSTVRFIKKIIDNERNV